MHPALRLEEILLNIFGHCYPPIPAASHRPSHATADLAALARTCHTFKQSALDVLWTELPNLAPLARCLPDACHRIYPEYTWYSFARDLKPSEWDTLRSYARRVRSVQDFTRGLNWESVKILFDPPTPEPMFPNLRMLRWEFIMETFSLMHHLAVPSLSSLDINFVFGDVPSFGTFPQPLADLCPNVRKFRIRMRRPQAGSDEAISGVVRRWTALQVLYVPYITLDAAALGHLSRTSTLTNLAFTLNTEIVEQIISSRSTLLFSGLRDLEMSTQSLESISMLLPHIRLPSLKSFTVRVDSSPSKYIFKSFVNALRKVCTPESLACLRVIQTRATSYASTGSDRCQLSLEDLLPCTSFGSLRRLDINTAWTVGLTDDDLLYLASAWPRLECLQINEEWGWGNEYGGVTPRGLAQLLERLGSLRRFCLAVDTRGYVGNSLTLAIPTSSMSPVFPTSPISPISYISPVQAPWIPQSPQMQAANKEYPKYTPVPPPRVPFLVNVADSVIQPESVDALANFFGSIMQQHPRVSSHYWDTTTMADRMDSEISRRLWEDVFVKAHEIARAAANAKSRSPIPSYLSLAMVAST